MNIKQLNMVLSNSAVSEQLAADLETVNGRLKVVTDLSGRCMHLLQQLIDSLQNQKTHVKK